MDSHKVLMVICAFNLLLIHITEGIVVGPIRPIHSTEFTNCSESIALIPTFNLTHHLPSSSRFAHTLTLPHTTTHSHSTHTSPHATTHRRAYISTPHTTTSTPSHNLEKPTLPTEAPKAEEENDKNKSESSSFFSDFSFPSSFFSSFFSSSSSSSTPPPFTHATTSKTSPPPQTSPATPPPPPPSSSSSSSLKYIPIPPSPLPTPLSQLHILGEKLQKLFDKQIPLVLTPGWAKLFQRPYLERIRAVNHEIVDKILQAQPSSLFASTTASTSSNTTTHCQLPEARLLDLHHRHTLLLLLLQALPHNLQDIEEAMRQPEITDYIFRPEKKALFDINNCRECYSLDVTGVCREIFFCKQGQNVFSRTSFSG